MTLRLRNRWLAAAAVLAVALGYLWLSSPGNVVVNVDGSVRGLQNDLREALQRQRFWSSQYDSAIRERDDLHGQPERDRKLQQELAKFSSDSRASMEQFYRENPGTRPSQATQQAEALRELADRIEQADLDRILENFRRGRLAELKQIIAICQERRK